MAVGSLSGVIRTGTPSPIVVAVGALLLGLAALAGPSPTGASQPSEPAEVISRESGLGAAHSGDSWSPSISADGRIVAYVAEAQSGEFSIVSARFRDRVAQSTGFSNPSAGDSVTISDDGCVLAIVGAIRQTLVTPPDTYAPRRGRWVYDRCLGQRFDLPPIAPIPARVRAGLSGDGGVAVFTTGSRILAVHQRSGAEYIANRIVIPPGAGSTWLVESAAISSDGTTVVFEGGETGFDPDPAAVAPWTRNIYVADVATGAAVAVTSGGGAGYPSISSDGRWIAYVQNGTAYVYDRQSGVAHPIRGGATEPAISRDGRHLVYRLSGDQSNIFASTALDSNWGQFIDAEFVSYPSGAQTLRSHTPTVSEHGRWVGWQSSEVSHLAIPSTFDGRDVIVVRQRRPALSIDAVSFGQVTIGTTRTRRATVTNLGSSGWRITGRSVSGNFSIAGDTCGPVLHPGESCSVELTYSPTGTTTDDGTLTAFDDSYPGHSLVATGTVTGRGTEVVVPDDTVPDDTVPDDTVPDDTVPDDTIPDDTIPDDSVIPQVGLSIEPNPVDFADTAVGTAAAGRELEVGNTGDTPVTIQRVEILGGSAGEYRVTDDECTTATLVASGTCVITVVFEPTTAGARNAVVAVSGTLSTSTSARLTGRGRFDAVLEVMPAVASGGQVVTVVGSGFPPSSTVEVVLADAAPAAVATSDTGGFAMPWLVLGGTPQGELLADDVAVGGAYDAEPASLHVVGVPVRPQSLSPRSPAQRRHVSR